MPHERLILIGYRGTGKTTVGRIVAGRLGWEFLDLDELIEAEFGGPITAIFAAEGETGFRNREARAVELVCGQPRKVIATGGGAILRAENRRLLRAAGPIAWLTASPETLWARMQADVTTAGRRPNLTASGGLEEVRAVLAAREPLYRQTADFAIDAEDPSPEAIATAILTAWTGTPTSPSSSSPPPCSSSA